MISVGFGQNIIDHYYYQDKYVGSCSGGSVWNMLSNIACLGGETLALGVIAGDKGGEIFNQEMAQANVDISYIDIKKRIKSNGMFINIPNDFLNNKEVQANYKCPNCGKSHWKTRKIYEDIGGLDLDHHEVLLIIDNIRNDNSELINALRKNVKKLYVAQDLGHKYNLRFKKKGDLFNYFSEIDILQIKKDVLKFLLSRMDVAIDDFMIKCNLKEVIVTDGTEGCIIHKYESNIYSNRVYNPNEVYNIIDSSGAGDVFFARYLFKTMIQPSGIKEDEIFCFCQEGVREVLNGIGAKCNIGIKLKKLNDEDLCECSLSKHNEVKKEIVKQKRKFKCVTNYDAVKKKINGLNLNINSNLEEVIKNDGIIVCIGTGASYISAVYVAQLLINHGKFAVAIYPYEIDNFIKLNIGEILIFTTSGRTFDNKKLAKLCSINFKDSSIRLVTTAAPEDLEESYSREIIEDSIIYSSDYSYQEHGFLSFWGVFGPIIYITLLLEKNQKSIRHNLDRINNRFEFWDTCVNFGDFVDSLTISEKQTIDVIYSSKYKSAAIALESMLTESGTYRCVLHEEKNYSHGRFVLNEHIPAGATMIIKDIYTTDYEKKLIKYLESQKQLVLLLECDTEFSEIDAIIAVYSWMIQYAVKVDKDVSKPEYSDESMKLYKFQ